MELGEVVPPAPLDDSDDRRSELLELVPIALAVLDDDWRFTYVNGACERLFERRRGDLLGGRLWDVFPQVRGSKIEQQVRRARESGEGVTFEGHYRAGGDRWYELQINPYSGGLSVFIQDVTARRAAATRATYVAWRARLVAEVSAEMAGTLDAHEAVGRLSRLLVPALADWCLISLVDGDAAPGPHSLYDAASWHADAEVRPIVGRYREERMAALPEHAFAVEAFDATEPVVVTEHAASAIAASTRPGAARELIGQLAPESAAFLALRGRDRTVGVLSLYRGTGRRIFDADDLAVTDEIAVRAGLALDNARLFRAQQQLAEAFQRSLLTAPPEPDHMQVVVRYEPAAETAQVGGDWYDAFLQLNGATVLVIGDVVGHDTAAAAAMGQLRSLLRGIAARADDGPADILRGVDQVMATLQVDTTATVVVLRVEQSDDEKDRGLTHVRWSNAGHPPPMAINPDGSVVVLAGVEADLLLGIDPTAHRVESSLSLDRGATVLLYTDGLVERRGQSLDDGLARLRGTLIDVAHLELDELCDEVLARMLPTHPDDDVALVAVRLHRQDRPRPPEAGPQRVPAAVSDND